MRKEKGFAHRRSSRKEWPPGKEKTMKKMRKGEGGGRKRRTQGPVPGEFLERFVRNFGRGGTLFMVFEDAARRIDAQEES